MAINTLIGNSLTLNRFRLLQSLFKGNTVTGADTLNGSECLTAQLTPKPGKVTQFNQVVGWQSSSYLAPTWLQVAAMPMYLNLLSDQQFPFSPLGLVHVENRVTLYKPLPVNQTYQLQCRLDNYRQHTKGVLFDIVLEALSNNELVYQGKASNLVVQSAQKGKATKQKVAESDTAAGSLMTNTEWHLLSSAGREYAAASGDYNPIHLFPLAAKLFGFRRHIAHGMLLKARALSTLLKDNDSDPVVANIAFRKPVFLPANITLCSDADANCTAFRLISGDSVHACGDLQITS